MQVTEIPENVNHALETASEMGGDVFLAMATIILAGGLLIGAGYVALRLIPKLLDDGRAHTEAIVESHEKALTSVTSEFNQTCRLQRDHDNQQNEKMLNQIGQLTNRIEQLSHSMNN